MGRVAEQLLSHGYEPVIIARKSIGLNNHIFLIAIDIIERIIDKCQLKLNVKLVEKFSQLSQVKQEEDENSVPMNVERLQHLKDDLLEVMDMLQFGIKENTSLNTELLCLNFLEEICKQMSKYTIETKLNLITDLKILKSLLVQNISENITDAKEMSQLGGKQNALAVEKFLTEEKKKLDYINTPFVQESVIFEEEKKGFVPNYEPIIVARKPFQRKFSR